MSKKILAITLALAMVFAFTACSKKEAEVKNPVNECSHDKLVETTGIDIMAPTEASDVVYSFIEGEKATIAQVTFKVDDVEYCYRAMSTDITGFSQNSDPKADVNEIKKALDADIQSATELSGMYYEWTSSGNFVLKERTAVIAMDDNSKEGFIAWIDVVPGYMYSLSAKPVTDQSVLTTMAEKIFVPMQGEV